jgi:hypothetical protein
MMKPSFRCVAWDSTVSVLKIDSKLIILKKITPTWVVALVGFCSGKFWYDFSLTYLIRIGLKF